MLYREEKEITHWIGITETQRLALSAFLYPVRNSDFATYDFGYPLSVQGVKNVAEAVQSLYAVLVGRGAL